MQLWKFHIMKMERKPDKKKNAFLESKDMYKYFF